MSKSPIKDQFYYSVSEYERSINPNITNEEVFARVEKYRQNPEAFHAKSYKQLTGKNIDVKTLKRVSDIEGGSYDPTKLSPTQINWVDNDKRDLIEEKKKIDDLQSQIAVPLDATDSEMEEYFKSNVSWTKRLKNAAIGMVAGPAYAALMDDEAESKKKFVEREKKKINDLNGMKQKYQEKIPTVDLKPVDVKDFFKDASKVTDKTSLAVDVAAASPMGFPAMGLQAVKNLGKSIMGATDFFSGNDSKEERQRAKIDSEKYTKVLEEKTKQKFELVQDPTEKQILNDMFSGKKPEIEQGFKPSNEFKDFLETYDVYNVQLSENATQFGSVVGKEKKTYEEQLVDYEQDLSKIRDIDQGWITKGVLNSPSYPQTWANQLVHHTIGGLRNLADTFFTGDIESRMEKAKKAGNMDEYLTLQRQLDAEDFVREKEILFDTATSTNKTGVVWEDRTTVDGFRLQVDVTGKVNRMVDAYGKTVYNLSAAQQNAIAKYEANPSAYKVESGFSRGAFGNLANQTGNTIVQMLPMLIGGVATAPLRGMGAFGAATSRVLPMSTMFVPQYDRYFKEEFKKTGDWARASRYATMQAGSESLIEWVGGVESRFVDRLMGKTTLKEAVKRATQKTTDYALNAKNLANFSYYNRFLKELFTDIGTELGEEFATLYAQSTIDKAFGKDGRVDMNDLITTALITPFATAPLASISSVANYKNNKNDFKSMVLAASNDVQKTNDIFAKLLASDSIKKEDAEKKMALVRAVKGRRDNYAERAGNRKLDFTDKEAESLENYMFEEAFGETNGKKVDYTKEVDEIIAAALKRSVIESTAEENEPIIPDANEDEKVDLEDEKEEIVEETPEPVVDESTEQESASTTSSETGENIEDAEPVEPTGPQPGPQPDPEPETVTEPDAEDVPVEPEFDPEKQYSSGIIDLWLRWKNRPKKVVKGDNFEKQKTVGVDGQYRTYTNEPGTIKQGQKALNFNISKEDAQILGHEIRSIAANTGIPVRIDVADADNTTDIPLVVSFLNDNDAKTMHSLLEQSEYYKSAKPTATDRVLGKKISDIAQFSIGNIKDLRNAQDIIENSVKDEEGGYVYKKDGDLIPISSQEYEQIGEFLFRAEKNWDNATRQEYFSEEPPRVPYQGPNLTPTNNTSNIGNNQPTNRGEIQTRVKDENQVERLNYKGNVSIKSAFDYQEGDVKEIPVSYKQTNGVLRINQGGVVEFDNGRNVIEFGNIDDIGTRSMSDLGIEPEMSIRASAKNELIIDDRTFINLYESPEGAIDYDENGNVISVDLQEKIVTGGYNGIRTGTTYRPITFTGPQAMDVAVILIENNIKLNPEERAIFEMAPIDNIEPINVPPNVNIRTVTDSLLPFFPGDPVKAEDMAKMYFIVAARMSKNFPQQFPTPESYVISRINNINEDVVYNENNMLIDYLRGLLENPDLETAEMQKIMDYIDDLSRVSVVVEGDAMTPEQINQELVNLIEKTPNVLVRKGVIENDDAFFAFPGVGAWGNVSKEIETGEYSAYVPTNDFKVKDLSDIVFDQYMEEKMFEELRNQGYDGAIVMEIDGEPVVHVLNLWKLNRLDDRLPQLIQTKTLEEVQREEEIILDELISSAEENRKNGFFVKDGVRYERNQEITGISGNKNNVRFSSKVEVPFVYMVVEADYLQPSHQGGYINLFHFIPEAQPKDRTGLDSIEAELSFATNPRFNEMGANTNAYSGAPVVNQFGEVIQGNNRTAGLKIGYNQGNKIYKKALIENAAQFGLNPDQVMAMKNPVLVRKLKVSDEFAIELGYYTAKDLETGGNERLDPVIISRKIPSSVKSEIATILFGGDEDLTTLASIRKNQKEFLPLMLKYLNPAQINSMLDEKGGLNDQGVDDIENIINYFLFNGGDMSLPLFFDTFSPTVRAGLQKAIPYLFAVKPELSLLPELQNALVVYYDFINGTNSNFEAWVKELSLFRPGKPTDNLSPLELAILDIIRLAKNQISIRIKFGQYAKLVAPAGIKEIKIGETPELVFGEVEKVKEDVVEAMSKKDAIKQIFNVEYDEKVRSKSPTGGAETPSGQENKNPGSDQVRADEEAGGAAEGAVEPTPLETPIEPEAIVGVVDVDLMGDVGIDKSSIPLDGKSESVNLGSIIATNGDKLDISAEEINLSYPGKKKYIRKITATNGNDKAIISFWDDNNKLIILHVESSKKGAGYGTDLINKVINDAKKSGIKEVVADNVENLSSEKYWDKLGFIQDPNVRANRILSLKETPVAQEPVVEEQPDITDSELYDILAQDLNMNLVESTFNAILRTENQLGDGVINRRRVLDNALKIVKLDGKYILTPEAIFEAVFFEEGYVNDWADLRKAVKLGGIDVNEDTVKRIMDVGIKLPDEIENAFLQRNPLSRFKTGDFVYRETPEGKEEFLIADTTGNKWKLITRPGGKTVYIDQDAVGFEKLDVVENPVLITPEIKAFEDLLNQATKLNFMRDPVVWQVVSSSKTNLEAYKTGKNPNGSKLTIKERDAIYDELMGNGEIINNFIDRETERGLYSKIVTDSILGRLERAFLKIKTYILDNTQALIDKARELSNDQQTSDIRYAIIGETGANSLENAKMILDKLEDARAMENIEMLDPIIIRDSRNVLFFDKTYDTIQEARDAIASADTKGIDGVKTRPEYLYAFARGKEERIWLATGWQRGVDGKWRYEIPDGNTTEFFDQKRAESWNVKRNFSMSLSEAFDAPELFQAYPQLKDYRVIVGDMRSDGDQGTFWAERKEIFVNNTKNYETGGNLNQRSILLHEIQHAIQDIEGFAPGGNLGSKSMFLNAIENSPEMALINKELSEQPEIIAFENYKKTTNLGSFRKMGEPIETSVNVDVGELRKYREAIDNSPKIKELLDRTKKITKGVPDMGPFEFYELVAGEVEARNVQKRMDYNETRRKHTMLSQSEDIDRSQQIILIKAIQPTDEVNQYGIPYESSLMDLYISNFPDPQAKEFINRYNETFDTGEYGPIEFKKDMNSVGFDIEFDGNINLGFDLPILKISKNGVNIELKDIYKEGTQTLSMSDGTTVGVKDMNYNDVVNGFYSPLLKMLGETKVDNLPVKQWMDKFGKGEEAKWTGLTDWLSMQQGNISKADIQKYLRDNRIEIKEVVKVEEPEAEGFSYIIKANGKYMFMHNADVIADGYAGVYNSERLSPIDAFNNWVEESGGPEVISEDFDIPLEDFNISEITEKYKGLDQSKYEQYQLDGEKENYKEILVLLPEKFGEFTEAELQEKLIAQGKINEYKADVDNLNKKYGTNKLFNDSAPSDDLNAYQYQYFDNRSSDIEKEMAYGGIQDVTNGKAEEYLKERKSLNAVYSENYLKSQKADNKFQSSHWDEPNVLVHIRMNTRTDADGNQVLFIEEIQSDWGQAGNKEGFDVKYEQVPELTLEEKKQVNERLNLAQPEYNKLINLAEYLYGNGYTEGQIKVLSETSVEQRLKFIETAHNKKIKDLSKKGLRSFAQRLIDQENVIYKAQFKNAEAVLDYNQYKSDNIKWQEINNQQIAARKTSIPSAPFVTKTSDWAKLALKVAAKEAVSQGADKIAWSSGVQQFGRWGSEEIHWQKEKPVGSNNYFINKNENHPDPYEVINREGRTISRFKTQKEAQDSINEVGYRVSVNEQTDDAEAFIGREEEMRNQRLSESDKVVYNKAELRDLIKRNLSRERNDAQIDKLTDKIWGRMEKEETGTSLPRKEGMEGFYGVPDENKLGIVGEVAKSLFKQEIKQVSLGTLAVNIFDEVTIIGKWGDKITMTDVNVDSKTGQIISAEITETKGFGLNFNDVIEWQKDEENTSYEIEQMSYENLKGFPMGVDYKEGFFKKTPPTEFILEFVGGPEGEIIEKTFSSKERMDDFITLNEIDEEDYFIKTPSYPGQQHSVDITPEMRESVGSGIPLFHYGPNGEILGFTHNGEIYLNGENITPETTMEEAGHIWVNWVKANRPDLYDSGLKKVKGSQYLKNVEANQNYISEALKLGPVGSNAYNNYLLEEALAKAISDQGALFVNKAKQGAFKMWVMEMWRSVVEAFGIRDLTPNDVAKLTLEQFARMAAADVFAMDRKPAENIPMDENPIEEAEVPEITNPIVLKDITILPSNRANEAEAQLMIVQSNKYYTLWMALPGFDRVYYVYLTTLSTDLNSARNKANDYMQRIANGEKLSEAFNGRNLRDIGSRKSIALVEDITPQEDLQKIDRNGSIALPDGLDYVQGFGKYKGFTLQEIIEKDPDYAEWLAAQRNNKTNERVSDIIMQHPTFQQVADIKELERARVEAYEEREARREKGEKVSVVTLVRGDDNKIVEVDEDIQIVKKEIPKLERRIVKDQVQDIIAPSVNVSDNVAPELKPNMYKSQIDGANVAIESMNKYGVVLNGDGAGVGKTRQIVAVADYYAKQGKTVFIISENAAIGKPWDKAGANPKLGGSMQKDSQEMGVDLNLLDGDTEPGNIYVSTYHRVQDTDIPEGAIVIFDESHNLVNTFGRSADPKEEEKNWEIKFKSILSKVEATAYYSATPADKPHQLAYLHKVLGFETPEDFLTEARKNGTIVRKRKYGWTELKYYDVPPGQAQKKKLYNWINNLMINAGNEGRFIKREISYEGTDVQFHDVKGTDAQSNKYAKLFNDVIDEMVVSEMAGYKLLAPNSYVLYAAELAKIGEAVKIAKREKDAGRKIIMFVSRIKPMEIRGKVKQFDGEWSDPQVLGTIPSPVDIIKEALGTEDISFVELHGSSKKSSQQAQKEFAEDADVLVASLESGGTGINLDDTVGNNPRTEIFMFSPYRGISTIQGMGRIWRASTIQNDNAPNRYIFITASDIDLDLTRSSVLAKKLQLMNAAIGGTAVDKLPMSRVSYSKKELIGIELPESGEESEIGGKQRTGVLKPVELKYRMSQNQNLYGNATADLLEWVERGGPERTGLGIRVFKGRDGNWLFTADAEYTPDEFAPVGINDSDPQKIREKIKDTPEQIVKNEADYIKDKNEEAKPDVPFTPEPAKSNTEIEIEEAQKELDEIKRRMLIGYYPGLAEDANRRGQLNEFIKVKQKVKLDDDIKKKSDDILNKLKEIREKGGRLGIMGYDPEQQAKDNYEMFKMGKELIELFIQKGYLSFKEIADEIIDLTKETSKEFLDVLKGIYLYTTAFNEDLTDGIKEVRAYRNENITGYDSPPVKDPAEQDKIKDVRDKAEEKINEIQEQIEAIGESDPAKDLEILQNELIIEEADNALGQRKSLIDTYFDPQTLESDRLLIGKDMLFTDYLDKGIVEFEPIAKDIYFKKGTALKPLFDEIKEIYAFIQRRNIHGYGNMLEADVSIYSYEFMFDQRNPQDVFIDKIRKALKDNIKLNIISLRALANQSGLLNYIDTEIQEYTELAIIENAREISSDISLTQEEKFDKIVALYELQPTISMRSSDRIEKQQYSTPIPISFMAGEFINKIAPKSVLEPSAGNGMMVFNVPSEKITVNEIDSVRLSNLGRQNFKEILSQDGRERFAGKYDAMITNPPFGSSPEQMYGDYRISGLDEQMSINGLDSLKDNGRAAIIIGGHMSYYPNGAVKSERMFINYLHNHYNVADIINISGSLYSKQGTSFPVRMILIDGRRTDTTETRFAPKEKDVDNSVVSDFKDLFNRVNNAKYETVSQPDKPVSLTDGGAGQRNPDGNIGGVIGTQGSLFDQPIPEPRREPRTTGPRRNQPPRPTVEQEPVFEFDNADGRNDSPNPLMSQPDPDFDYGPRIDIVVEPNYVADVSDGADRINVNEESVFYTPQSKGTGLMSKIPTNMAQPMYNILRQFGDIDAYVQQRLQYKTREQLYNALSAEQIDGVAMAIYQIERNGAMIIGDMTGMGKGREAAAIIRYAVIQGKKPIFITEKPDLFSDMHRDLTDIGSENLVPFIVNSKGDKDPSITKEVPREDGSGVDLVVVHKAMNEKEKRPIFESGTIPDKYDYAVATYSQFNASDEKGGVKKPWLANVIEDNIFIMDESHNAGGSGNTNQFFLNIIGRAKGGVFASATFAKRPDNMPVYALKTDMSKASMSDAEIIDAVQRGGLPLQQIMSANLVSAGQMARRERDFTGVTIDWDVLEDSKEEHTAIFNSVSQVFYDIINFQRDYVDPVLEGMNDELADQSSGIDTSGISDFGISNTPFASKTFNAVRQLLLSLKAKDVARIAIEELRAGRKPVIAMANTMESFLKDMGFQEDEKVDNLDYSLVLKKGLDGVMRYRENGLFESDVQRTLSLSNLSEEGQEEYNRILQNINKASIGITISPIDVIFSEIKNAGYNIGELTGRKQNFEIQPDGTAYLRERKDTDKKTLVSKFNSGELDALIINQSGSTGISLHASEKYKDRKQRVMLFAQTQLDINTEIQLRGRIDRTGQGNIRGAYRYIISPVPAEKRLIMMFRAKLKSLDANTTSNQKSKLNEVDTVDFLNKYGDEIVIEYLKENMDINERLMDPFELESMSDEHFDSFTHKDGAASSISGKVQLLLVEEQERFYNEVTEKYNAHIEHLNNNNANDLEIKVLNLNAELKASKVVVQGSDNNNPFASDSLMEEMEIDVLKKPMTSEEIQKNIDELLGGKDIYQYRDDFITDVNVYTTKLKDKEENKIRTSDSKKKPALIKKIRSRAEKNGVNQGEILIMLTEAVRAFDSATESKVDRVINKKENIATYIRSAINILTPGKVYLIPVSVTGNMEAGWSEGIFVGFKHKGSLNASGIIAVFAVNDGRRKIDVPLSKTQYINSLFSQSRLNPSRTNLENWDSKSPRSSRKRAYIATGNLLQSFSVNRHGQLITFTMNDGTVRQGILMPDNYNADRQRMRVQIISQLEEIRKGELIEDILREVEIYRRPLSGGYGTPMVYYYKLFVPKTKSKGAKYFSDPELRNLVDGRVFVQEGNRFRADVSAENLEAVLKYLSNKHNTSVELEPVVVDNKKKGGELLKKDINYNKIISDMIISGEIQEVDDITEEPCIKY